ncbi:P-loop containing nucleoside triphosphate hydrolase protein [Gaertneriomyces semiglobifer]|nr:P-loop containing nucleoside triphosphate hydrolase protein [Gaertneriomyces semiglobifer]
MESVAVDLAFGEDVENETVYRATCVGLIGVALGGGVGTFLAYGQTGSGKTHTLTGIQQSVARDLFEYAREYRQMHGNRSSNDIAATEPNAAPSGVDPDDVDFDFHASFFELFANQAYDLLNDRAMVKVQEDKFGSIQIQSVTEHRLTSTQQFLTLISQAAALRRTEATAKNSQSSRSHAICRIRVTNRRIPSLEDGLLYLVDLAGSESTNDSKFHDKDRLSETREINKSLHALKECIRNRALSTSGQRFVHVPYRTSKLTMLLKSAFEIADMRQSRTVIVGTLAPSIFDTQQTSNTLRFISNLKVAVPVTKQLAKPNNPLDPSSWDNAFLRSWVTSTYSLINPEILCPYESGKQLCRVPEGEFIERCLKCPGTTEKRVKAFYLKLWGMVVDQRTRGRKEKLALRPGVEERRRAEEEINKMMIAAGER